MKTTGALENRRLYLPRPASLPNAMIEPVKVTAPMKVPMNSSIRLPAGIGTSMLNADGSLTTANAMSTAARPTSECIAATSSGICVICTRLETMMPMTAPTASAPIARSIRRLTASVVRMASAMPIIPNRLPRRALSGCDSPRSDRMKRMLASRYASATWFAVMFWLVVGGW